MRFAASQGPGPADFLLRALNRDFLDEKAALIIQLEV